MRVIEEVEFVSECNAIPECQKLEKNRAGVGVQTDDDVLDFGGRPPFELWASTSLTLRWLPRCDNLNNPILLNPESLPEPAQSQKPNLPMWFWRVTIQFGAWVFWAIRRADSEGATVQEEERRGARIVRAYLEELDPDGKPWDECERIASLGKPKLPGSEIRNQLVNLARFGFVPRWVGWEKHAQIDDDQRERRESEGTMRAESESPEESVATLAQRPRAAPPRRAVPRAAQNPNPSATKRPGLW